MNCVPRVDICHHATLHFRKCKQVEINVNTHIIMKENSPQEFQSRAESDHGGEAKSRGRCALDPRDPKASLVPGRAPPGQERADLGCSRPPPLTFRQRVQHPRLLQVPPELLALRVGGLRRHGGSGTGAQGRSRKTARPAAGPKPCTRPNSHPAPPARPEPRRAPLTL